MVNDPTNALSTSEQFEVIECFRTGLVLGASCFEEFYEMQQDFLLSVAAHSVSGVQANAQRLETFNNGMLKIMRHVNPAWESVSSVEQMKQLMVNKNNEQTI